MSDQTARLALPFIAPGQAQKELFHNEALARIDAAVQASVVAAGLDTPPDSAIAGQCWIVGDAPAGAWAGQAGALAAWTDGGWRFVAPFAGLTVWLISDSLPMIHDGTGWTAGLLRATSLVVAGLQVVGARQPAVAPATGGATIDMEARAALSGLISALVAHGLVAG
jgi:hypothetical protein